jgi:hypothetical protein
MNDQQQPSTNPEATLAGLLVEIENCLQSGGRIDWEGYRAEYPEHFDELVRLAATVAELNRLDEWPDDRDE